MKRKIEMANKLNHKKLSGVRKTYKSIDGNIRKSPKKFVLIAAGIGAAVGAILTAVMMKRKH